MRLYQQEIFGPVVSILPFDDEDEGGTLGIQAEDGIRDPCVTGVQACALPISSLGICLGLQILFESSEESPGVAGLGWFKGPVKKLLGAHGVKIPHMGWNALELRSGGHRLLEAAGGDGEHFSFVRSFHGVPSEPDVTRAPVSYGPNSVPAAVARDHVFASQFHPEK